jgi:hypothetical protein
LANSAIPPTILAFVMVVDPLLILRLVTAVVVVFFNRQQFQKEHYSTLRTPYWIVVMLVLTAFQVVNALRAVVAVLGSALHGVLPR